MCLILFKKNSVLLDAVIHKTSGSFLFHVYTLVFILWLLINSASHSPPVACRSGDSYLFALITFTFSATSLSC